MNRTITGLLTLAVTCAACGGKVVVDGSADAIATGGGSASGTSGAGASSGGSTGAGGCDAASHTIDIASFNVSCLAASDCMPVFIGDYCGDCKCPFAAINVADAMKYDAEQQIKSAGAPPGSCFCPALQPTCVNGQCATKTP